MDRRNLHKVNAQKIGKNKEISSRTRATNRAARQDALRELQPEVEVVKPSRMERLQKWRLERDEKKKKKEEEEIKRKPFVSVVKRGVFLDTTNYTELNKQRRKKTASKKVNASLPVPKAEHVASTARKSIRDTRNSVENSGRLETHDEENQLPVDMLAVPDRPSELNTTFETPTVENSGNIQTHDEDNQLSVDLLAVPDRPSELNATFETPTALSSHDEGNQLPVDMLAVPDRPSELNTTFEMKSAENSCTTEQNIGEASAGIVEVVNSDLNSTFELINSVKVGKESIETTPSRSSLNSSLNYVSPFVTIARGKGSAHKEVKVRESFYKLELSQPQNLSPLTRQNREAAEYFRYQVQTETENLNKLVDSWDTYKNENDHVDSVYLDQIDVAIGQTRLLIAKKFKQFLNLCSECEKGVSQPPVLPKDLEGFWSMVFMQVENCNERFQKLATLKENDWVEVDLLPANVNSKRTKTKKATKKGTSASSGIQRMIEEARLKMKENRITTTAAPTPSKTNVGHGFGMKLRQTPARLSLSTVKTPKSIIKAKTLGGQRNPKSVAFSIESPSTSKQTPKAAATPKPRVIKRRASTSGIPTEKQSSAAESSLTFLTPSNRKVSNNGETPSSTRRSHRRLFSVADK